MRPLQKEIIKCKELISEIYIEKYDQEEYEGLWQNPNAYLDS